MRYTALLAVLFVFLLAVVAEAKPRGQGDVRIRHEERQGQYEDDYITPSPLLGQWYYYPYYNGNRGYYTYYDPYYYNDGLYLRYDDGDWQASFHIGGRDEGVYYARPLPGHPLDCRCNACLARSNNNLPHVHSPRRHREVYYVNPDVDYYSYQNYQNYALPPGYGYYWPGDEKRFQEEPPVINIYNYPPAGGAEASADPQVRFEEMPPVTPPPAEAQDGSVIQATRFHQSAVIALDGQDYTCTVDKGFLSTGAGVGPSQVVAQEVDSKYGVLAISQPGYGISFYFIRGGYLTAAVPTGNRWLLEPLPVEIDFNEQINIGALGGAAWILFTDQDGVRYIMGHDAGGWYEVGSGSFPEEN